MLGVKKPVKKNRLMSIDPSINNLGVAIWDMDKKEPILWKLVHPKKDFKGDEYAKSISMADQIREWKKIYLVNHVIMEVPEHWAVGGFEARETGSIAKLCFVCGLLFGMRYDESVELFQLVSPRGWKGQLPKDVVANRLQKDYLQYGIDLVEWANTTMNNVGDAIAIGHFKLYGRV
jgi:hypothetical protein